MGPAGASVVLSLTSDTFDEVRLDRALLFLLGNVMSGMHCVNRDMLRREKVLFPCGKDCTSPF